MSEVYTIREVKWVQCDCGSANAHLVNQAARKANRKIHRPCNKCWRYFWAKGVHIHTCPRCKEYGTTRLVERDETESEDGQ